VDDRVVRAGRARLPLWAVGEAVALDASSTRRLLGRDADPQAYLMTRPWARTAVRVSVIDRRDPHPYWLVASRRPRRLAEAIIRARTTHAADG
jgi:hypothetical protein